MIQGREGIALGILTVAAFLGCLPAVQMAGEPGRNNNQAQYTEGASADQELAEKRRGIKNKRPAPDRSVCNQAQTEKEYDMCQAWRAASAAQEAADAAWWQIYISWIGLAGLLGTLILTGIAAKAAAKAARETARSVDVQIRTEGPLLHVNRIVVSEDELRAVKVYVKNFGRGPATLIAAVAEIQIDGEDPETPVYRPHWPLGQIVVEYGSEFPVTADSKGTRHMIAIFSDSRAQALLWGYVIYEDIFKRRRKLGFGRWTGAGLELLSGAKFTGQDLYWRMHGDEAYNYDREEPSNS